MERQWGWEMFFFSGTQDIAIFVKNTAIGVLLMDARAYFNVNNFVQTKLIMEELPRTLCSSTLTNQQFFFARLSYILSSI